jgi:hypothetical protein
MIPRIPAIALGTVLFGHLVGAQDGARIAGRIVNKATGAPLAGADVELAPGARRVVSDDSGRFRIDAILPGNVTLFVKRIGFVPESLYVTLGVREDLDVVVELQQSVQQLDTVNVAAAAAPIARGKLAAFHERKRVGIGRFIDSTILAQQENRRLGELIASRTPGSRLIRAKGSGAAWLATTRGSGSIISMNALDPMDRRRGADPRACYPDVYLDGAVVYQYGNGMPLFDLNGLTTAHVAAIEVYVGPGQTPIQYAKVGAVCGVVLIWSK